MNENIPEEIIKKVNVLAKNDWELSIKTIPLSLEQRIGIDEIESLKEIFCTGYYFGFVKCFNIGFNIAD